MSQLVGCGGLYPLKFVPIYQPRMWGGSQISEVLHRELPPVTGDPIGESWELVDREKEQSVVSNGPLAGSTMQELLRHYGRELVGRKAKSIARFPLLVKLIMQSIYKNDRREIKHIGCKRFGVQYLLKGIYVHNDLLYFHLQLKNSSNVPFNVDYLTFKITDKKVAKRTAIQEQVVWPVRAYNNVQVIGGKRTERMVFTLPKFTLADDKQLVVELHEQQGGRHQTFTVENADLVRARVINELKVK